MNRITKYWPVIIMLLMPIFICGNTLVMVKNSLIRQWDLKAGESLNATIYERDTVIIRKCTLGNIKVGHTVLGSIGYGDSSAWAACSDSGEMQFSYDILYLVEKDTVRFKAEQLLSNSLIPKVRILPGKRNKITVLGTSPSKISLKVKAE